ncbi:MAG: hypothetical protein WD963_02205 [Candidatus Paceibacterota bacterium]
MLRSVAISLIVIIILAGVGFFVFKSPKTATDISSITNFEECAKAGFPIMESYPAQCRSSTGELFVQKIENPTPVPDRIAAGYIAGSVTIGPFCPVEREGEPCTVPPEAYTSRSVIIYEGNGTTIREKGKLDSNGKYNISIGPGNYFIQIDPAGIGPGEKKPATVKSFETTVVDFDIDTGIR